MMAWTAWARLGRAAVAPAAAADAAAMLRLGRTPTLAPAAAFSTAARTAPDAGRRNGGRLTC